MIGNKIAAKQFATMPYPEARTLPTRSENSATNPSPPNSDKPMMAEAPASAAICNLKESSSHTPNIKLTTSFAAVTKSPIEKAIKTVGVVKICLTLPKMPSM